MHIILGLIFIAIGVLIMAKSEWLLNNFGRIGFFDRHLGSSGGTRLGYKLIGLATLFIGVLIFTNMIGGFLTWILSPLLKYTNPSG